MTDVIDSHIEPHFETSALLVIDTQEDFLDGGAAPIAGTVEVLPLLRELVAGYRAAGLLVMHVIRLYTGDDIDLVRRSALTSGLDVARPGSAGSRIASGLLPLGAPELDAALLLAGEPQWIGPRECVIWKPRWSAFHRTPLHRLLTEAGVDTVTVAGCNFPNCPRATIFDASELDYRVVVAVDAVSQTSDERLADASRIGAVPRSARDIVDRLDGIGTRPSS